MNQTIQLWGES